MVTKKIVFSLIGAAFFLVFTIDKQKKETLILAIKKGGKVIVVIVPLIFQSFKPAHAVEDYTRTLKVRLLNHHLSCSLE